MNKENTTRDSLSKLNALVQRESEDRKKVLTMISQFRSAHGELQKKCAQLSSLRAKENKDAKAHIEKLNQTISGLQKQLSTSQSLNKKYEDEMNFMSASIEAANNEFSNISNVLVDTASSIEADYLVMPDEVSQPVAYAPEAVPPAGILPERQSKTLPKARVPLEASAKSPPSAGKEVHDAPKPAVAMKPIKEASGVGDPLKEEKNAFDVFEELAAELENSVMANSQEAFGIDRDTLESYKPEARGSA